MKISHRLALLIAVAIGALLVVGALGVFQFTRTQGLVSQLTDDALGGTEVLYRVNNAFKLQQIMTYNAAGSFDSEARGKLKGVIADQQKARDTALDAYSKLVEAGEEQARFDTVKKAMADFDAAIATTLKTADDFGDVGTALNDMRSKAQAADQTLKTLVENQLAAGARYKDAAQQGQENGKIQFGIIILVAIGVLAVLGALIARAVQRPLAAMQDTVSEIGESLDFTRRVPVYSQDEVGLTVTAFNGLVERVQHSLRGLGQQVDSVAGAASQLSSTASELTRSAAEASESSASVAATVEEVTVSITHVADRSHEADQLSRQSGTLAREGGQVIESTVTKIDSIADTVRAAAGEMTELQARSENVSAVVNVIRDIADQTNLLALNAAIEAARAGEMGRGFAVVADEVRKLAERTSSSTREIADTILAIQQGANTAVERMQAAVGQVEDGVNAARQAGQAISEIRGSTQSVVGHVSEISEAIREQSAASNSIAQVVERIAQMAEESSAAAGNTSGAASQLQSLANEMRQAIQRYRV
ncbi:methyl-accepting chemotaxis protein [Chitinibacteraceae bacterium HSL-7]